MLAYVAMHAHTSCPSTQGSQTDFGVQQQQVAPNTQKLCHLQPQVSTNQRHIQGNTQLLKCSSTPALPDPVVAS